MPITSTTTRAVIRGAAGRPLYLLVGTSLLLAVACQAGDDDDVSEPREDGGASLPDSGRDAGMDGGPVEADSGAAQEAGADGGPVDPEPDAEVGCLSDADCSNGLVCDGLERCVDRQCLPPLAPKVCTLAHPCVEEAGGCDCRNPNLDRDDFPAMECGGT